MDCPRGSETRYHGGFTGRVSGRGDGLRGPVVRDRTVKVDGETEVLVGTVGTVVSEGSRFGRLGERPAKPPTIRESHVVGPPGTTSLLTPPSIEVGVSSRIRSWVTLHLGRG